MTPASGERLRPGEPDRLLVARRLPLALLFLLAILLGAAVAGGTSYALRTLNY